MHPRPHRSAGDEGSTLFLMPAAVLIIVVLGAITGDMTRVHIAQRDLIGVANSIANDAVTYGLDETELRSEVTTGGTARPYPLSRSRATDAALASIARHASTARAYELDEPNAIVIDEPNATVTVRLRGTVNHIFAPALSGKGTVTLRATASAQAVRR